MVNKDEYIVTC